MNQQTQDRNAAILWARSVLDRSEEYYILDTETTGLNDPEVIELAVIDIDGEMMINQQFKPKTEISLGATNIHGITNAMLALKPEWPVVGASLERDIFTRKLLIYNYVFDDQAIRNTYELHNLTPPSFQGECVMQWYSHFCGEWNEFRGSYRWQKLPGGDHSALGDCIATMEVIELMACSEEVKSSEPIDRSLTISEAIAYDKEILNQ